MSEDIKISVGTKLYVSAAIPATYNAAGYAALDWTEVGEVENVPSFGGSATITEFIPLSSGVVNKKKGSINYGDMTVPLGMMVTDAGQIALQSAFDGANKAVVHSVRLSNPTIGDICFTAEVASFTYNYGDANAVTRNEVMFAVKTKPVVAADVYKVTYLAGENGYIVGESVQYVLSGGDTRPVYAAGEGSYALNTWDDTSSDNPRVDSNVTEDITVTASFGL